MRSQNMNRTLRTNTHQKAQTLADKIISFNTQLYYPDDLPDGFQALNPYLNNPETLEIMEQFYQKYYADQKTRRFIIGINPSRHGAGVTGIPFTDTKRLESACGIQMKSARTHEVSSVFIYDMIEAYGGAAKFYQNFYINSPFPLALVRKNSAGNWLNANYYDDKALEEMVRPFMLESLKQHIALGLDTSEVYILGKKNAKFIQRINENEKLFDRMIILDHPRYIQQYRSAHKQEYILDYLNAFGEADL